MTRQNKSPLKWLMDTHPDIYSEYLKMLNEERLEKARQYQANKRKEAKNV